MLPDWDEEEALAPRTHAMAWRVGLAVFFLLFAGALLWAWQRYDPAAADRKNIKESQELMETANKRFLTEAEFDRVVALLNCGTEAAQLAAISIFEIVVARAPNLRDRAVAALENVPPNSSPVVHEEAGKAAERLKAKVFPKW